MSNVDYAAEARARATQAHAEQIRQMLCTC